MYSSELETLDQLLGGDLPLEVISKLFLSREAFEKGILGLLSCGDVVLLTVDGVKVPDWRWRELFSRAGLQQLQQMQLKITPQGARRVN
jgi:hypothetical protein